MRYLLAVLAFVVSLPAQVGAQTVLLDEGVFEIRRGGEVVGRETFTIHRVGPARDATILAQGTVTSADTEMKTILETGSATSGWAPLKYSNALSGSRDAEVVLFVEGRRLISQTTTEAGEGKREFRPGESTVILEPDIAFLYHFAAAQMGSGLLTVVEPLEGRQTRLRIEPVGAETFRLGTETLPVRRIRLSSGDDVREILVDDQNRVLRVEIPAHDFVAVRIVE